MDKQKALAFVEGLIKEPTTPATVALHNEAYQAIQDSIKPAKETAECLECNESDLREHELIGKCDELRFSNAELVEALRELVARIDMEYGEQEIDRYSPVARETLAKHGGA